MINTVTLAMKFYQQPEIYTKALDVLNMIFTAVFALEFVFKLAAFRFKVQTCIYARVICLSLYILRSRYVEKSFISIIILSTLAVFTDVIRSY